MCQLNCTSTSWCRSIPPDVSSRGFEPFPYLFHPTWAWQTMVKKIIKLYQSKSRMGTHKCVYIYIYLQYIPGVIL